MQFSDFILFPYKELKFKILSTIISFAYYVNHKKIIRILHSTLNTLLSLWKTLCFHHAANTHINLLNRLNIHNIHFTSIIPGAI